MIIKTQKKENPSVAWHKEQIKVSLRKMSKIKNKVRKTNKTVKMKIVL